MFSIWIQNRTPAQNRRAVRVFSGFIFGGSKIPSTRRIFYSYTANTSTRLVSALKCLCVDFTVIASRARGCCAIDRKRGGRRYSLETRIGNTELGREGAGRALERDQFQTTRESARPEAPEGGGEGGGERGGRARIGGRGGSSFCASTCVGFRHRCTSVA